MGSLSGVRQPPEEEEAAGLDVTNQEDKRMIGPEDGRRGRWLHDGGGRDGYDG
jgi:hypothetical protein